MEKIPCFACEKPKATLTCGICEGSFCKNCVQFVDEDQFSFLTKIPDELKSSVFCEACYSQKVVDQIARYEELMDKAKSIDVFLKKQYKETRFLKRLEEPYQVTDCDDYDETILRLAFFAAEAGFSAIIDVVVESKKVTNQKYHTTKWTGIAIPVHLDPDKLIKDRSTWENPN